jgi:uncharacterized membrane protein (DUF485 family)
MMHNQNRGILESYPIWQVLSICLAGVLLYFAAPVIATVVKINVELIRGIGAGIVILTLTSFVVMDWYSKQMTEQFDRYSQQLSEKLNAALTELQLMNKELKDEYRQVSKTQGTVLSANQRAKTYNTTHDVEKAVKAVRQTYGSMKVDNIDKETLKRMVEEEYDICPNPPK